MSERDQYWVVVPAAGVGARFKASGPKQYVKIDGRTLLDHTLSLLLEHPRIAGVVVAIAPDDGDWQASEFANDARVQIVEGGAERCESVLSGLQFLMKKCASDSLVLVHDAARPCLQHEDIDALLQEAGAAKMGAILAVSVKDTLKRATSDGFVAGTVDRSVLWHALTPQVFQLQNLVRALQAAVASGATITDEASAMEFVGLSPRIVAGHATNLKVTVAEDLILVEAILRSQGRVA